MHILLHTEIWARRPDTWTHSSAAGSMRSKQVMWMFGLPKARAATSTVPFASHSLCLCSRILLLFGPGINLVNPRKHLVLQRYTGKSMRAKSHLSLLWIPFVSSRWCVLPPGWSVPLSQLQSSPGWEDREDGCFHLDLTPPFPAYLLYSRSFQPLLLFLFPIQGAVESKANQDRFSIKSFPTVIY